MPTKITFTFEDAVEALLRYHCLPDDAEVNIDMPLSGILKPYVAFAEHLVNIGQGNINVSEANLWRNKIPMIKELRQKTGMGLKDSKLVIDEITVKSLPSNLDGTLLKSELDIVGVIL